MAPLGLAGTRLAVALPPGFGMRIRQYVVFHRGNVHDASRLWGHKIRHRHST